MVRCLEAARENGRGARMTWRLGISHVTRYRYDHPVSGFVQRSPSAVTVELARPAEASKAWGATTNRNSPLANAGVMSEDNNRVVT
jgi:hypothetical protein